MNRRSLSMTVVCLLAAVLSLSCGLTGCGSQSPDTSSAERKSDQPRPRGSGGRAGASSARVDDPNSADGSITGISAEQYADQVLSDELLAEGWVRLFDNLTQFGWFRIGNSSWRVENGRIRVERGDVSFLCTQVEYSDFELKVDFRSDADSNSGVFLRSSPSPSDPGVDCIELNIAPPNNPFPTGSLVKRLKVEPELLGKFDPTEWHTFHIRAEGKRIQVSLDDKPIVDYEDDSGLNRGFICLQHNAGDAEFRNILLKPLGAKALPVGADWESYWQKKEKSGDKLSVTGDESGLHITGGLGQLESKDQWDDFILQAVYQIKTPDVNSGIFFRCIPGNMLDGYECQINHTFAQENRLMAGDEYGAGGIFKRERARVVLGDGSKPTYLTLIAEGAQISTWIDGVQVVDFADARTAHANPRIGLKREAGTIALQGHDPFTDVVFKRIEIAPIRKAAQ
ncbi:MAG: DUF1080 domain-containing protein [Pirellulales bacterium]